MGKNKEIKTDRMRISPVRLAAAGALFVLLLAGTYTYLSLTFSSQKLAMAGTAGGFILSLVMLFLFRFCAKKGILHKTLKILLLAGSLATVLAGAFFLNSSHFVPHKTTTVLNRCFPETLEASVKLQDYLDGKTLYADPSVTYFDLSADQTSAITYSNIASVKSSVKDMLPLEDPIGLLKKDDIKVLAANTDEYELVDWKHFREINLYLFYDVMESEDVVVLWGKYKSLVFMTPAQYEAFKEAVR